MATFDAAKAIFSQVDTNQDGSIDRNEFRNWAANGVELSSSSDDASTNGVILGGYTAGQGGIRGYEANVENAFESISGINTSYAAATASSELTGGTPIQTSSEQQTSEYLSQTANGVYNDPNPQIIRRPATVGPLIYQQKVFVRFLQPPPIPPPGPLIIKEVRPPQPPPPPPLVVRQRAPPLPSPPPLILRERPPVPPAPVASQTVIRRLNAVPLPPRSVIIERLPPVPPKPRDIIIERWIPYGYQAKRRTIVQRAPPAIQYPQPRNVIVVYEAAQVRIVRQFQRLGITQENPRTYVARYGATLLDAATLVQQARSVGVVEDISPPAVSPSTGSNSPASYNVGTDGAAAAAAGFDFSSLNATGFEGLQVIGDVESSTYGLEAANNNSTRYSSSTNFVDDSVGISKPRLDVAAASFVAADTNHDGRLDRAEFQRFIQGGI